MARRNTESLIAEVHDYGVNVKSREIYLHSRTEGAYDGEPGVEYAMATGFIKNLHLMDQPPNKPILVHLHSIGGCWDNGMAIFNAVQFSTSYVTMLAYSQASSMSGIILQSAPLRVMMPDCHFMMHYGWDNTGENHPLAIKCYADFGIKACKRMIEIFAERAIGGKFFTRKSATVQSVAKFFDKKLKEKIDWYMDAEEAVWYGLADCILGCKEYPTLQSLRGE